MRLVPRTFRRLGFPDEEVSRLRCSLEEFLANADLTESALLIDGPGPGLASHFVVLFLLGPERVRQFRSIHAVCALRVWNTRLSCTAKRHARADTREDRRYLSGKPGHPSPRRMGAVLPPGAPISDRVAVHVPKRPPRRGSGLRGAPRISEHESLGVAGEPVLPDLLRRRPLGVRDPTGKSVCGLVHERCGAVDDGPEENGTKCVSLITGSNTALILAELIAFHEEIISGIAFRSSIKSLGDAMRTR